MAGNLTVFLLCIFLSFVLHIQGYKLKQVLILSRHNIRTPLVDNMQNLTTYEFPTFHQRAGYLTEKGALLEGYMGEYFRNWLVDKELILEGCPNSEDIHIYANTRQRTRETAKAFANAAFKNCDIRVFSINSKDSDPVFDVIPLNTSIEFKRAVVNDMQRKLNELQLQDSYAELNSILNLKQSKECKINKLCDLSHEKNEVLYQVGIQPDVSGPLNIANDLVDFFLMSYYDGMPLEKVAWGQIKTQEQWKLLTKVTRENQNVRFNSTTIAKEISRPLFKYILGILHKNNSPKFTLLVGHDSNITPVMASIGFLMNDLPEQYEPTPVGGKLVFQKIEDHSGKMFMKVDFVYQTFEQLRNGTKLSLENPPRWLSLRIKDCSDENNLCPWEYFIDIIKKICY